MPDVARKLSTPGNREWQGTSKKGAEFVRNED